MTEKYFNVKERGTFFMAIEECKDVAKLSDHFITEEKLKELCGDGFHSYNKKAYFNNNIIATIEEWILIIPPNALSTTLVSRKIKTMLYEINTDKLRYLCPTGYSIKGSRLYNTTNFDNRTNEKNEKELEAARKYDQIELARPYEREQGTTTADSWSLAKGIRDTIREKYGVSTNHHGYSTEQFVKFGRRLCNWPEIKREIRKHKERKIYVQDIKWIKKLWDYPEPS